MRAQLLSILLLVEVLAGCAGQSALKPVEVLDDRTGMTVGALREPIELVPGPQSALLLSRKHMTFAYLGPVEWNRSGTLSYGLWVHIAPGVDQQTGDIHAPSALSLILDDGPLELTLIDAPRLGADPYRQVVSWGQTAYFGLDVASLRRMAASRKLALEVRAAAGSGVTFSPTRDTSAILTEYLSSRGITGD
jgi:hypothetical protein